MGRSGQVVKVVRVELTRDDLKRLRRLGASWRGSSSDAFQRLVNTVFGFGLNEAEESEGDSVPGGSLTRQVAR